MVRWLKLFFHSHKWKTIDWMLLEMTNERGRVVGKGRRYIQECETCGLVKKRDLV